MGLGVRVRARAGGLGLRSLRVKVSRVSRVRVRVAVGVDLVRDALAQQVRGEQAERRRVGVEPRVDVLDARAVRLLQPVE